MGKAFKLNTKAEKGIAASAPMGRFVASKPTLQEDKHRAKKQGEDARRAKYAEVDRIMGQSLDAVAARAAARRTKGAPNRGEERPSPGKPAAYSYVPRQIANGLPSKKVISRENLRALTKKMEGLRQALEIALTNMERGQLNKKTIEGRMERVHDEINEYPRFLKMSTFFIDYEKAQGDNPFRRRLTGLAARFERHLRQ